jgi:magnesium chelatase subunit D
LAEFHIASAAGHAADALLAAAICALDPPACGGIAVRTDRGAACEAWLERLRELLDQCASLRRLPPHIDDERLLGGTDLASTLRCGRSVFAPGLLAEADGGVILMSMAERVPARLAAVVAAALDSHSIAAVGAGRRSAQPARFGLVALDGGQGEDERCPVLLSERLSMQIDLHGIDPEDLARAPLDRAAIARARRHRPRHDRCGGAARTVHGGGGLRYRFAARAAAGDARGARLCGAGRP